MLNKNIMANIRSGSKQQILFMLLLVLVAFQLRAQTPFTGTFTGFGPGTSTPPTITNLSITAFNLAGVSTNAGAGRYNTTGWDAGGSSENAGKYIYYTVTPATGYKATITSVSFPTLQSSNTGPTKLVVKYVLNSGTPVNVSTVYSFSASASAVTGPSYTINPGIVIPEGGNLQIRLYAFGGSASGGTFSLNNSASIGGTVEPGGPAKPTIINPIAVSITHNEARLGATVSDGGGAPVTSRGIVWGTTSDPAIGGSGVTRINVNGTTGTFDSLVPGLPEGTLIYYRGFAINSSGTVYTTNSSFYTLSSQPDAVTGLTANAISDHDIRLDWTPSPNANGYVVLQKLYTAPTSFPVDRTRYKESDVIGDAEVVDTILNGNVNTALYSNLISGTVYQYAVVAYRYNGTAVQTYNYNTTVPVPIAFDTTWGVGPSALSDIAGIPQSEAQSISSIVTGALTTTNTGVKIWQLSLRDGGAALTDADAMPTTVTKMVLVKGQGNKVTSWLNVLAYAALYNDSTGAKFSDAIIYKDSLVFNGMNWVAADNNQKTLTLRVSLKTSGIIDRDSFRFAVRKANIVTPSLSVSSQIPDLDIQTDSLKNVVDVVASKILITQQPPASTGINAILPQVKAMLVDSNGNTDLDNNAAFRITSAVSMQYPQVKFPLSGMLVFDSVSFSSLAKATRLKISGGGLDTAYTDPVSVFASSQSIIRSTAAFVYTDSILYTNYQSPLISSSNSVPVFGLTMIDGGAAANDGDNFGTTLSSLRLNVGGSAYIRSLALYQGTTKLAEQAVLSSDVLFNNFTVTANDNDSVSLSIRATFNSRYAHGQRISFTVTSAIADTASGSVFALANAGGATSVITGATNVLKYIALFVTPPVSQPVKICAGSKTIITAVKPAGTVLSWYVTANSPVPVYTGDSLILNTVDESVSYFVATDSAGWLSSKEKVDVIVAKIIAPAAIPLTVCRGNSASVQVNSAYSVKWYRNFTDNNPVYTGNTFNAGSLNADTVFYIQADSAGCLSKKVPAPVLVARVAVPVINDTIVCKAQAVTLNAAGIHAIKWFNTASSSTVIANGSSLITSALQRDTTFYIESDSSGCSSVRKPVRVAVRTVPLPVLLSDSTSICSGNQALILTLNGADVNWYQSATAVNPLLVNDSFTTPALSSTSVYYVAAVSAGCLSERKSIVVKVNAFPSVPVIKGDSVCMGEKLTLEANSNLAKINWYDAEMGGNKVSNTNRFVTPAMNANTVYYVEAESSGCSTARIGAPVTVKSKPAVPVVSANVASCSGQQLKLGAFAATGSIKWFASATDTTSIGSDSLLTAPLLADVKYYAATERNGCTSNKATVNIKVNTTPDATFTINEIEQCLENNQFVFMNAANPQATQYTWLFGDTSSFGFMNPVKTYRNKGAYTVKLKTTNNGCTSEYARQVKVNAPDVDFTYTVVGSTVSFVPVAAGISSYKWRFTNTDSSASEQAQHTFSANGTYAVTLTVTDANGCSSSVTKNVVITRTGLTDVFNSTYKLEVYPNPFKDRVKIDYNVTEKATVKIGLYDVTGRLVKEVYNGTQQAGIHQELVNRGEQAPGIYLLKIQVSNQVKTIRLIAE